MKDKFISSVEIIAHAMIGKPGNFTVRSIMNILADNSYEMSDQSVRANLCTLSDKCVISKEIISKNRVLFVFASDFTEKFSVYFESHQAEVFQNKRVGSLMQHKRQRKHLLSVKKVTFKKRSNLMIGKPGTTFVMTGC